MRLAFCIAHVTAFLSLASYADDWPRFRGPGGTGIATAPGLPVAWTSRDVAWETLLPGVGHSSPVVVSNRLFVTTASQDGSKREIVCLNTADGSIRWRQSLTLTSDKLHAKNSHASGTPVASNDVVIVTFADDDRHLVTAFDHDGNALWRRDLGSFASQHGHGASPIIWRELVIVPNDQDGPSSIVAMELTTGNVVWSADRPSGNTAYGTPIVIEESGKAPQLICSSQTSGISSLEPATGRENWRTGELPQRTVGSPVYAGGLVFQSCGQAGRGTDMIGADPFATSDDKRVVFAEKKTLPYVPTPVACGDNLFLWNDNGVVVALSLATLKPLWSEPRRIEGNYSASPICVNENIYAVSEDGDVVVAKATENFEVLGRSSLGDRSHATPAVADGRIFFRTFHKVVCVAAANDPLQK